MKTLYALRQLRPRDLAHARQMQEELRKKARTAALKRRPRLIAGLDASFSDDRVTGAASLFRFPSLEHVEDAVAVVQAVFPYVPGYLTFREGPALVMALRKLGARPELLIFDGQGMAHPREMGIATHLGVLLGVPSIGCAKSRLVGRYREPGRRKGSCSELKYGGKTVGAVLRTRTGVKPVFVSPGHGILLSDALEVVMACVTRFRIPEPLRKADRISRIGVKISS